MEMRSKHIGHRFPRSARGVDESAQLGAFGSDVVSQLILHSKLVCQPVVFQINSLNQKGNKAKKSQFARNLHTLF